MVVCDDGYYSVQLLHAHAVFRLQSDLPPQIRDLIQRGRNAGTVLVGGDAHAMYEAPLSSYRPCRCRLRFARHFVGSAGYVLATTLLDGRRYSLRELVSFYHDRREIELWSTLRDRMPRVGEFSGRSERAVKQELFARLTQFAMARPFVNRGKRDSTAGQRPGEVAASPDSPSPGKAPTSGGQPWES